MDTHKHILVTSPTGTGKTTMEENKLIWALEHNFRCLFLTQRQMLFNQISEGFTASGIPHGLIASGYPEERHHNIQLAMTQTLNARGGIPKTDLLLIDEAHQQKQTMAQKIIKQVDEWGGTVIGYTATPTELGHIYTDLIVACDNQEGRYCGALLPCWVYGPDEPDLRGMEKKKQWADWSDKEAARAMGMGNAKRATVIFGRVKDWWERLNPERKPTLLFGPDVAGSLYFAQKFYKAGINAAHIDGKNCWWNGDTYDNDPTIRKMILKASEAGELPIICNRFVMREGINAPWIGHLILATCVASVTSYIQIVGRLLRNHPSMDKVILQDHGGNWHRHPSPNDSIEWTLDSTDRKIHLAHRDKYREKEEPEPLPCPECKLITMRINGRCQNCGHQITARTRTVIQTSGKEKLLEGKIYPKPHRIKKLDTASVWKDDYYYRGKNSRNGMTFAQLEGLFVKEQGYWPSREIPLMPRDSIDFHRRVKDVEGHELIQAAVSENGSE
jgi:superfamily II DNA or RNA helicase